MAADRSPIVLGFDRRTASALAEGGIGVPHLVAALFSGLAARSLREALTCAEAD